MEPSYILQGFSQFSETIWYLTKTVLGLDMSKQHGDADRNSVGNSTGGIFPCSWNESNTATPK